MAKRVCVLESPQENKLFYFTFGFGTFSFTCWHISYCKLDCKLSNQDEAKKEKTSATENSKEMLVDICWRGEPYLF